MSSSEIRDCRFIINVKRALDFSFFPFLARRRQYNVYPNVIESILSGSEAVLYNCGVPWVTEEPVLQPLYSAEVPAISTLGNRMEPLTKYGEFKPSFASIIAKVLLFSKTLNLKNICPN